MSAGHILYHPLVAVGWTERLVLIGGRVQDVQYVVLCSFKSTATGWHKKKAHSLFTPYSAPTVYSEAWMLTQNSCNKTESTASPRLIPTCESVHTVNKEVRTKQIILNRQDYCKYKTKPIQFTMFVCLFGCHVSIHFRQKVCLLTLHMPQKWNFSSWKRRCHSSFLSPCLWCHCECLYMSVCCWVNQGWLRLN